MASETLDEKDSSGDGSPPIGEEEKKVGSDRGEEEMKDEVEGEKEEEEEEEKEEKEKEKEEEEEKKERGKKRGRRKKDTGEEKKEEEGEGTGKKERKRRSVSKEAATPVSRPSRERKTVERYSELTPRSTSAKKAISIEKGSGIMLKDIPNVTFKLSKRKGDENLQALHTILYGRKSNAHYLKRNISQFSGFVWTENEEKQKGRVKEKLDKCSKEKLLDFCDILDIHLKATAKKEEVSSKLLEFLESPYVTRDLVLAEKEEKGKKRGRTKGTSRTTSADASVEREAKRQRKNSKESVEAQEENEDHEISADSKDASADEEDDEDSVKSDHSKSEDEEDEVEPVTNKKVSAEKLKQKGVGSRTKEKNSSVKKDAPVKSERSPLKGLSKKIASEDESDEQDSSKDKSRRDSKASSKVKDKHVKKDSSKINKGSSESSPRKRGKSQSSKAATQNERASKKQAGKLEPKSSTKKQGKGKGSRNASSGPSTEELHAVVSDLLKEVDFDTATLADILRQLGAHFDMDMMDRKAEVKRIVEDVINSMSCDEDGGEDEDGGGDEDDEGDEGEDGAEGSEGEDTKEESDGNEDK
ncbi:DEK domain-containing chromatin-associated protein 1-like [Typha latifolia]|uniref:DEK domain-containing chromatin-associated protein 1-like n=1 Tax=Typha latifolia TaxID=4733 RepID=UPI003C2C4C7E